MKKISLLLISCALLFSACSKPNPNQLTADKPEVTIAPAKAYEPLANNMLGVNENGKGLAPGSKLDSITLTTIGGENYELSTAWQQQPALIVFYRGGWCPYCNMQVRELSQHYDAFVTAGVQPILISVDAPARASLIEASYDIPFPVLSDTELLAHFAFNVALELDAATLEQYKTYGIVPSDWSGLNHNTIAVASAFIVDQQGIVRFSHATADFRTRPSAKQLLAMIGLLNF